jgi:hypothetical protein
VGTVGTQGTLDLHGGYIGGTVMNRTYLVYYVQPPFMSTQSTQCTQSHGT